MKYMAIDTLQDTDRVNLVHHLLFHGEMVREGAKNIFSSGTHDLGDDLSVPMLLTRSGTFVPPLFKPGSALILTEEAYGDISQIPGVDFAKAIPKKLINYWKPAGDFSFYNSSEKLFDHKKRREDKILDWMKNDESLFQHFPICYELVLLNIYRCQPSTDSVHVEFVMDNDRQVNCVFDCQRSVLDDYPAFWGYVPIFRRDAFDLIEKYVNYDYFHVVQVEI